MAITIIAPWSELNWGSGSVNPREWIVENLDDLVDDYDVDSLTAAWVERINQTIHGANPDLTLKLTGDLTAPDGFPGSHVTAARALTRRAIRDAETRDLARMHDHTGGPYFIEIAPRVNIDSPHQPLLYEYDTEERRTPAQVIADAKDRYGKTTGLEPQDLRHRFLPQSVLPAPLSDDSEPFAPIDPQTDATILSMDALELLHRTVVDPDGDEWHVDRLTFEARGGGITIWCTLLDDDGDLVPGSAQGFANLAGWAIL